jgi:hypothetical protein
MGNRRAVVAVIATALAACIAVAAVLTLGLRRVPNFGALADDPDPRIPGVVAFERDANGDECIYVVAAGGGAAHEVRCERLDDEGLDLAGWNADGLLIVRQSSFDGPDLLIDVQTGREVLSDPGDAQLDVVNRSPTEHDGSRVAAGTNEGRAEIVVTGENGSSRVVTSARGPKNYAFEDARWSSDGAWIFFVDSEDRLLVVAADGRRDPRVIVDDVIVPFWDVRA